MAREQQHRAQRAEPEAPTADIKPAAAAPVELPPPNLPKSDRYRVKGPGGVFAGGSLHEAGSELQLSEADVLSVLEYLEQI